MDKKKLIGMIVGVTLFAVLIAGATFAWLTFEANVVNGNYAGKSLNFTYTYGKGTDVSGISILGATPARNQIAAAKGYVELTVSKPAGSAKASSFNIKLHKTSGTINPENVIRYAVCRSTTATTCNNAATTAIPSTTDTNFVAYGQLGTWDGSSDKTLYSDTTTFAGEGAANTNYYVYLWIDGTLITDSNQDTIIGKSFSGYIHASSTQTD